MEKQENTDNQALFLSSIKSDFLYCLLKFNYTTRGFDAFICDHKGRHTLGDKYQGLVSGTSEGTRP